MAAVAAECGCDCMWVCIFPVCGLCAYQRGDPLQREKILAQPLKRKGLVAMGVHL